MTTAMQLPMRYGRFGGCYAPETLIPALSEVEAAFVRLRDDAAFNAELDALLKDYAGRPTPLYRCANLSADLGIDLWLKREDLLHGGAHKTNNALGQGLLAKHMGKQRLIAETGAGQHGFATAMIGALLGLPTVIYMGAVDVARQRQNVLRMRLCGAEVIPVETGGATLKDAINDAMRDWITNIRTTIYIFGTAAGPHPFPTIVRHFQSVIGCEAREQFMHQAGAEPDYVVACVGGGSNAIGIFSAFLGSSTGVSPVPLLARDVQTTSDSGEATCERPTRSANGGHGRDARATTLIGVEPAGDGIDTARHGAPLAKGEPGVFHGALSMLLQTDDGQILETHSAAAGLDYPGVGPEHAALKESGAATYTHATDAEALAAFQLLCRREGIIPALESAHALAAVVRMRKQGEIADGARVLVNLSGRGDKDLDQVEQLLSPLC